MRYTYELHMRSYTCATHMSYTCGATHVQLRVREPLTRFAPSVANPEKVLARDEKKVLARDEVDANRHLQVRKFRYR